MYLYFCFGFLIFLLENQRIYGLNCKDTVGNKADWFFGYMLPGNPIKGYAYKLSSDSNADWRFSNKDIMSDSNSIIVQTFSKVYKNPSKFNYVMFNDILLPGQTASFLKANKKTESNYGSSKGALVWHKSRKNNKKELDALLFIHSVRQFMAPFTTGTINYPDNDLSSAKENAQIFVCLKINHSDVEKILGHLILNKAQIYSKVIPDDILYRVQNSIHAAYNNGKMIIPRQTNSAHFLTRDANKFAIVTKTSKDSISIWRKTLNFIRPNYRGDFYLKSYRNSQGFIKSDLSGVTFKEVLSFKLNGNEWDSVKDASQWGITYSENWVCLSDISNENKPKLSYMVSSVVCIYNQYLKKAMLLSIGSNAVRN